MQPIHNVDKFVSIYILLVHSTYLTPLLMNVLINSQQEINSVKQIDMIPNKINVTVNLID